MNSATIRSWMRQKEGGKGACGFAGRPLPTQQWSFAEHGSKVRWEGSLSRGALLLDPK